MEDRAKWTAHRGSDFTLIFNSDRSLIAFLGGFEGVDGVISQIKVACEGISCFYIIGHGIDQSLMKNVMKCGRDFFNLPMDKKVSISLKKSTAYRGYIQQGDDRFLRCNWLPERARWRYLAHSGLPAASRKKPCSFSILYWPSVMWRWLYILTETKSRSINTQERGHISSHLDLTLTTSRNVFVSSNFLHCEQFLVFYQFWKIGAAFSLFHNALVDNLWMWCEKEATPLPPGADHGCKMHERFF